MCKITQHCNRMYYRYKTFPDPDVGPSLTKKWVNIEHPTDIKSWQKDVRIHSLGNLVTDIEHHCQQFELSHYCSWTLVTKIPGTHRWLIYLHLDTCPRTTGCYNSETNLPEYGHQHVCNMPSELQSSNLLGGWPSDHDVHDVRINSYTPNWNMGSDIKDSSSCQWNIHVDVGNGEL